MAQTPAERQAAFKARRSADARRLDLWIPDGDRAKLLRLARHHGISQAELVGRLLRAAEDQVTAGMGESALDGYYGVTG